MSFTVKHLKPNGYFIFNTAQSNTIALNGNPGANNPLEQVQSMQISEVMWTGDWNVSRGSDRVLTLRGTGHHDYQAAGTRVESEDMLQEDLGMEKVSANGNLIIKVHKTSPNLNIESAFIFIEDGEFQ